jgi:hypothetical protein
MAVHEITMDTPLSALEGVGARVNAVFDRAGYTKVGDVHPRRGQERHIQEIIDAMAQEQGSSGEVQWFRLASRVCNVIARIRSAEASPVVPDYYCCPLSGDWMVDPVTTPHGQSYERSFIEEAIRRFGVDPLTRRPLSMADLVPNRNLQEAIRDFQMHFLRYAVPYNIAS